MAKDRVALIIAKMKGGKKNGDAPPWKSSSHDDEYSEGSVGADHDGLESAAEDIIDAVEGGDARELVKALKSFLNIHCSQDDEESDDEEV